MVSAVRENLAAARSCTQKMRVTINCDDYNFSSDFVERRTCFDGAVLNAESRKGGTC